GSDQSRFFWLKSSPFLLKGNVAAIGTFPNKGYQRIWLCCLIVAVNIPMQTISYKLGEARTPSEKYKNFRIVMSS
ncbi:hypothetical protein L7I36_15450, partial [Obesumbacterium proteus]|uniref:hypothetical protein n=1 Tax=Obesumbacterium proteus TaxID=82983 RepID=UPI001EDC3B9B